MKHFILFLLLTFTGVCYSDVSNISFQKNKDGVIVDFILKVKGTIQLSAGKSKDDCCVLYSQEKEPGKINLLLPDEVIINEKEFPMLFITLFSKGCKIIRKTGGMGRGTGQFIRPMGCHNDDIGNIYVADSGNDRIQVFSPELLYLNQFGEFDWDRNFNIFDPDKPVIESAKFNEPRDIICRREIYIVDWGNSRICRYNRYLEFLRSFGREGNFRGEFYQAGGITMDDDGYIYLADRGNDRVQKLDADGNFHFTIGSFGYGNYNFNSPSDVAVDSERRIYVLDSGNGVIKRYSSFGNYIDSTKKESFNWKRPESIKIYDEKIWVVDSLLDRIDIMDMELNRIESISSENIRGGKLSAPYDITIISENRFAVTNMDSHEVLLIEKKSAEKFWSVDLNDLRRNL